MIDLVDKIFLYNDDITISLILKKTNDSLSTSIEINAKIGINTNDFLTKFRRRWRQIFRTFFFSTSTALFKIYRQPMSYIIYY